MPAIDVHAPVSSAPADRLALGCGWVRPGVAGVDSTLNPSGGNPGHPIVACFEGS